MNRTTKKIVCFWIGKNYNQIFIIFTIVYIFSQLLRAFINSNF